MMNFLYFTIQMSKIEAQVCLILYIKSLIAILLRGKTIFTLSIFVQEQSKGSNVKAYTHKLKITNDTSNDKSAPSQTHCRVIHVTTLAYRSIDKSWSCFQLTTNQSLCCILCKPYLNIAHGYANNCCW